MATQNSIFKLLLHLYFLINIFVFSSTLTFASSLAFNFSSLDCGNKINCERGFANNNTIALTGTWDNPYRDSAGRATYFEPLHLWDKVSGNLSSFQTNFSFAINSRGDPNYGDGLTFFFAPIGSKLDNNMARGEGLGIGSKNQSFFAVEFDTYPNHNYGDPDKEHVGIDIDSMNSVTYMIWKCDVKRGKMNHVWITYDSITHNLSVTFTGFESNNNTILQNLHYVVDFRLNLPEWVTFGFSASTGSSFSSHTIYSWDFKSTLNLALASKLNLTTSNPNVPPTPPIPDHSKKVGLVIGLCVGAIVLVGGLVVMVLIFFRRKKKIMKMNMEEDIVLDDNEFERGTGPRKFSYNELARATDSFREDGKLGEGGFGGVYRGFLRDLNCYVAVKRVSKGSRQGIKEYASEVKIISQLRHRNLVQLIGWCHERGELLLVYEFMPNGSLDAHLFKENSFLTWEFRYKIAQGIASALLYLHEEWEKCVVHRDIKSSNVMLDSDFNAKLGDFGLARLVDHAKGSQTTLLAGTMGYMAPECATTGRASKESDVYSFGIVALEIVCGRRPFNPNAEEGKMVMVQWVWELYGSGKILEAIDSKFQESTFGDNHEQQMECLMVVGLWCAHPDSNCRPSIKQAIHVLNFEAPLPLLPSKLPTPSYDQSLSIIQSVPFSSQSITQYGVASQTSNNSNTSNVFTSSSQETACLL